MFEKPIIETRILKLEKSLSLLKEDVCFEVKGEKANELSIKLTNKNNWNKNLLKDLYRNLPMVRFGVSILESLSEDLRVLKNMFRHIASILNGTGSTAMFDICKELWLLDKKAEQLVLGLLFKNKADKLDCYVDIQTGSGGVDSQDWTSILLRMYLRWSDLHRFKVESVYGMVGDLNKPKAVTIKVIGVYAYGWLKTETGIHRLVRKSPYCSNGKRHTSFSSISVYPVVSDDVIITICASDLRVDTFRSSGAGGQHVNKTDSAVRVTHLPTNIITQCQSSRSQYRNKEYALKQLKSKLYQLELTRKTIEKESTEPAKASISWGNQIRSYVLDSSIVKDLRTGLEVRDVQAVLNGSIDMFIIENLRLVYRNHYDYV